MIHLEKISISSLISIYSYKQIDYDDLGHLYI